MEYSVATAENGLLVVLDENGNQVPNSRVVSTHQPHPQDHGPTGVINEIIPGRTAVIEIDDVKIADVPFGPQ